MSTEPVTIKDLDSKRVRDAWYYTDRHGIDVIVEVVNEAGAYVRTVSVRIPRRQLAAWVKRTEPRT